MNPAWLQAHSAAASPTPLILPLAPSRTLLPWAWNTKQIDGAFTMAERLNIENHSELLHYLQHKGKIERTERLLFTNLQGGISNRTVLVEPMAAPAFVLKQALPKLRVATDWPSDPHRIHQEALGLIWLDRLAPAGSIPAFLFEDPGQDLLAMQAVARPHENWKVRLLSGGLEIRHVKQFGELLGTIHGCSTARQTEIALVFEDRSFFESLRLDPYYRYSASRTPAAGAFFHQLILDTLASRTALVHGDYSPKNILLAATGLVLLDHEVIHWGDPAFDVGFALTHLLSKANHIAKQRNDFLKAAAVFWESYSSKLRQILQPNPPASLLDNLEARSVRHTLGCLLARVDGRSPLEYLSVTERERQRTLVLTLLPNPPVHLLDLITLLGERFKGGE